jgi:hypothetical protein
MHMHAHMHTHMHTHMRTRTHIHAHAHTEAHTHAHSHSDLVDSRCDSCGDREWADGEVGREGSRKMNNHECPN